MKPVRRLISRLATAAVAAIAAGCAAYPPAVDPLSRTPTVLLPATRAGLVDQRAGFRQALCALTTAPAGVAAPVRDCDYPLVRVRGETDALPVGDVRRNDLHDVRIVVVLGFAWDCVQGLFDGERLPARHLAGVGYDVTEIHVDGLAGSAYNAQLIQAALSRPEIATDRRPLVLIGYSKGAVDILEAVTRFPETAARVAAVISIAGAIGGSPLADEFGTGSTALLRALPGAHCGIGDGEGLHSLSPTHRQAWLADHPLPHPPRYYSLVAFPGPDSVSPLLASAHRRLSQVDARNDGSLLPHDQLIPGAALLGYVDADHWSIALPVDTSPLTDGVRNLLWEAAVRFVESDLARERRDAQGGASAYAQ